MGQKYSQYGTIQQSEHAVRTQSKNNLNTSAYHSNKPPLGSNERGATGPGQGKQGSLEVKSRLNNTQPISSQKRISKHRAANAATVTSTEKIRHGPGKGGQSVN